MEPTIESQWTDEDETDDKFPYWSVRLGNALYGAFHHPTTEIKFNFNRYWGDNEEELRDVFKFLLEKKIISSKDITNMKGIGKKTLKEFYIWCGYEPNNN